MAFELYKVLRKSPTYISNYNMQHWTVYHNM